MRTITLRVSLCLCPLLAGCELTRIGHEEHYPNGKLKKTGEVQLFVGDQVGDWKYYYRGGNLRAAGPYEKDKQVGRWTYWFKNGQKEMEGIFAGQRRSGAWSYWYSGGEPRANGSFDAGRETGPWTFYGKDGKRERNGYFDRGRMALRWTYWHPGGEKKKAEGYYLNGVKVGRWRFWGADGSLAERRWPLPDGYQLVQEMWEDGKPRREGFLRDGDPQGLWIAWHRGGALRMVGAFEAGKAEGRWNAYDGGGELVASGPVLGGRLSGEWTVWADGEERPWLPEDIRPPGLSGAAWSEVGILEEYDAEDAVEIWLAEVTAPLADAEGIEPGGEATPGAIAASREAVAEVSERPEAPVRANPRTVREEKEIDSLLHDYGTSLTAGTQTSSRYGAVSTRNRKREGDTEKAEGLKGRRIPHKRFPTGDGGTLDLSDFEGKKNVLLVILRGFAGEVCVYCLTQTKALEPSKETFEKYNTEVIVVYPGTKNTLGAFLAGYEMTFPDAEPPPYRFIYDPELELTESLGLSGDLAVPSTLLLDRNGVVRYAYVGKNIADRPPAKDLIKAARELKDL